MHIYKFSLPEGTELKINYYGAEAQIRVTYRDLLIDLLGVLILGEKTVVRRGVLGTSFVVSSPEPGYRCDLTSKIRRFIRSYDEGHGQLRENLRHLEGMPINPTTMNLINEQSRRVFDETRERLRRTAERHRPVETEYTEQLFRRSQEALHNQAYDGLVREIGINPAITIRADENLRPNEMAVFTQGVVNIGGNQYTINGRGYASIRTEEQVRIAPNGSILHLLDID